MSHTDCNELEGCNLPTLLQYKSQHKKHSIIAHCSRPVKAGVQGTIFTCLEWERIFGASYLACKNTIFTSQVSLRSRVRFHVASLSSIVGTALWSADTRISFSPLSRFLEEAQTFQVSFSASKSPGILGPLHFTRDHSEPPGMWD